VAPGFCFISWFDNELSFGLAFGVLVVPLDPPLAPGSVCFCFAERLLASGLAVGVEVVPPDVVPGCSPAALPVVLLSSTANAKPAEAARRAAAIAMIFIFYSLLILMITKAPTVFR
jgi:hypothetical protein